MRFGEPSISSRRLALGLATLALFWVSHSTIAEHAPENTPASSPESSAPTPSSHPAIADTLRDKEVNLLMKVFQSSEDYLRSHLKESLPNALNKIKDGSEDEIATIMAEMMGTLNDTQLTSLRKSVETEMQSDDATGDPRYLNLLKRLKWAKEIMKPTVSTPELPVPLCCSDPDFAKFKEAFEKAWKKTKAHNDEFYNKLDQALAGSESAKDFLRSKYDSKALLAFIEAQRDSGNVKLANDLTKALAFEENGSRYLDTLGQNGSKDRIHLGAEPENLASKLKEFSQKTQTPLRNLQFSPTAFNKPDRVFRNGLLDTKTPVVTPNASTTPVANSDTPPSANPVNDGMPETNNAELKQKRAEAFKILEKNCTSCHGPEKFKFKAFGFASNGVPAKRSEEAIKTMLERMNDADDPMPPKSKGGQIGSDLRQAVEDWAKLEGILH